MEEKRICPECGKEYSSRPALSRKDNKTMICPKCGMMEALDTVRDFYAPRMTDQQWKQYKEEYMLKYIRRRVDMDKSLYNASGCKDRTAHDAICAADRTRTLVYRASRTKKDEEAELFVKMVKRLAKGFGFKLCDRIKFEDPETGKKYV